MGTLALLLGVGIPAALRAPADGRGAGVAALVRAFSPVALLGAGTAAATGVASALFHLGAPAELWGTGYGRALLLKLALLALAAAAGFRNWRVHTPRLESDADARALRRTVAVEVAVGVLVVLVTAVLVALPTP
jgi:putative copper export protein